MFPGCYDVVMVTHANFIWLILFRLKQTCCCETRQSLLDFFTEILDLMRVAEHEYFLMMVREGRISFHPHLTNVSSFDPTTYHRRDVTSRGRMTRLMGFRHVTTELFRSIN